MMDYMQGKKRVFPEWSENKELAYWVNHHTLTAYGCVEMLLDNPEKLSQSALDNVKEGLKTQSLEARRAAEELYSRICAEENANVAPKPKLSRMTVDDRDKTPNE
jgi:hypothetical protein